MEKYKHKDVQLNGSNVVLPKNFIGNRFQISLKLLLNKHSINLQKLLKH